MCNVNLNSPFTEIFSYLGCTKNWANDQTINDSVLPDTIIKHVDNSIGLLMQGLQDLGQMLGFITQHDTALLKDLSSIGFFISAISNLTEALNLLRVK